MSGKLNKAIRKISKHLSTEAAQTYLTKESTKVLTDDLTGKVHPYITVQTALNPSCAKSIAKQLKRMDNPFKMSAEELVSIVQGKIGSKVLSFKENGYV